MSQRTPCIHGVHLYPSKPLVHPLSKLSDKCCFTLLIPNLFFLSYGINVMNFFILWMPLGASKWTSDSIYVRLKTSGVGERDKLGDWDWHIHTAAAAAAKLLQSCLTLCDPIDSSPPESPVLGILQARTPEWVAICFSNAWKWKVKVKLLSRVRLFRTP